MMKGRFCLLLAILLATGTQAAINDPLPFEAEYDYIDGLNGGEIHIVSGGLQANLNHVGGSYGFFDTGAFEVAGLERVCWNGQSPECHPTDPDGGISLLVTNGGSVGMRLPLASDARYDADHALGLFVDFGNDEDLNSFGVEQSLAAAGVNGVMTFENIRHVAVSGFLPNFQHTGGLVPLDDETEIRLLQDGIQVRKFQGKEFQFSMEGKAEIAPFQTDLVILPFEDDSVASFDVAGKDAAAEGLQVSRVNDLMNSLQEANADDSDAQQTQIAGPAEGFQDVMAEILNGAILKLPMEGEFEEDFAFINFDVMRVTADLDTLEWRGAAALQMEGDEVQGAPALVGFSYFQLPWWSFLLWGLAIVAVIVRFGIKAPAKHETWDRFKWVGWVFGGLMFLLLFWLWDLEVRSVWGTSLLTTDATGAALGITAAVQIAPLLFVMFAVAAPIRMLIKNGLMMGRQGTFMGLGTGVSYLLAYVLGATLLLAYIELVLATVMENLSG